MIQSEYAIPPQVTHMLISPGGDQPFTAGQPPSVTRRNASAAGIANSEILPVRVREVCVLVIME
jgi:hypothetical protein